ncbi:MAG: leucine-rich repeat protein [Clostridia bacterium]|nr:leucine-rich repeat protein [Clostridia bacterium]
MAKKRIFVIVAFVLVMALSVIGLTACGKPASDLNENQEQQKIEKPTIPSGNEVEVSDETAKATAGLVYEKSADGKFAILTKFEGKENETTIVVASEYENLPVTAVANGALKDQKNISSVVLPKSVLTIGENAFADCSKLTSIDLGTNLKFIGNGAFKNVTAIKEIKVPNTLETIGMSAFRGCAILEKINLPEGLKSIGDYAFMDCTKINEVVIPSTIKAIGRQTFYDCIGLKKITLLENLETIGEEAFRGSALDTEIVIPNSVTEIGEGAFRNCTSLKNVTIPENVNSIEKALFKDCTKLDRITIQSNKITKISDSAFEGCLKLNIVIMPDSVTEIGAKAFEACDLSGIYKNDVLVEFMHFSSNLEIIGESAFANTNFKTLALPSKVIEIGAFAFSRCENLVEIELPHRLASIKDGAFRMSSNLETIKYRGEMQEWENLYKVEFWDVSMEKYVVDCTDGKIEVDNPLKPEETPEPPVEGGEGETPEIPDQGGEEGEIPVPPAQGGDEGELPENPDQGGEENNGEDTEQTTPEN